MEFHINIWLYRSIISVCSVNAKKIMQNLWLMSCHDIINLHKNFVNVSTKQTFTLYDFLWFVLIVSSSSICRMTLDVIWTILRIFKLHVFKQFVWFIVSRHHMNQMIYWCSSFENASAESKTYFHKRKLKYGLNPKINKTHFQSIKKMQYYSVM